MKLRLRFKIPKWWIGLQFTIAAKKREGVRTIGVCNKVGNRYVPFLDYDYDNKLSIFGELRSLQENNILGNAYIFKTKHGYHVIFLDLLTYDEWLHLLDQTSCDQYYKEVPQMNDSRMWVLRLSQKNDNKITFETVLWNQQVRAVSGPHQALLRERGVPLEVLKKNKPYIEEDDKKLIYARYEA